MASRLNANPSYGILEEDDHQEGDPVYELVDPLHCEHQYRNASAVRANERRLARNRNNSIVHANVHRLVRKIRCLCCTTVILGVVAVLALLTAVVAVSLTLLLNQSPSSDTTDSAGKGE